MKPMSTVPVDGRTIRLFMSNGRSFLARPMDGLLNENGEDCWNWCAENEDEAPDDWTDGVCWEINDAGNRSTYPVGWRHT